ncbi:MAG: hypothetical protein LBK71_10640 [Verrucomicrobiales bacterium]|jgi:cell division protein FtsZ|nr:hypothetical protein [Verrucomicrobiales bacterium]
MIDFKNDGEFQAPTAASLAGHVIIGLGSAGVNIADQLMLEHREHGAVFGFDTDEQVIRGSIAHDKLLLGLRRIHGLGAGGDPALAAEIAREERREISDQLQGTRSAVLVTGLGGGTGSGMAPEFCRLLKQLGATVVVLAVTPFAFEGRRRLQQAAEALASLRREADAVLCLSNSRLLGCFGPELDLRQGFAAMNGLVGRASVNLRAVLHQTGPMQIHLADLRNVLAAHADDAATLENCWAGCGLGAGADRARAAVDEVLGGPLFADGCAWSSGTAVIACLSGGGNLSIGEFQTTIEYLRQEIPVELPILAGMALEPGETEVLGLTLLVVGQTVAEGVTTESKAREELALEPAPAHAPSAAADSRRPVETPPAAGRPVSAGADELPALADETGNQGTEQKYFVQQEELPLDQKIYRGRFEKSAATICHGEDLDQPTFMRRNVKIRL